MMLYLFDLKGPETSPLWQRSRFKMHKKKKKLWKMPRVANAVRALWHWHWLRLSYFWTLSMGASKGQQGIARNRQGRLARKIPLARMSERPSH